MSLFCDMIPDQKWLTRGNVDRNGSALSQRRALQMHAAISMRNYGIWAIILTFYGYAGKVNHRTDPMLDMLLWILACVFFVLAVSVSLADTYRNQAVQTELGGQSTIPKHLFETIAIPALVFGFFIFVLSGFFWRLLGIDPSSKLYLLAALVFKLLEGLPWMGLTALLMGVGAWQRWIAATLDHKNA